MLSRLSQLKARLGYGWHRFMMKHTYWLVERRDGKAGYVSYGDRKAVKHFAVCYLGTKEDTIIRRKWRWGSLTEKQMRCAARKYGLAATTDQFVSKADRLKLLAWPRAVELVVDLPPTLEEYRKSIPLSAKSDIRRIRKSGLSMKVSRSRARLEKFYHQFYVPSALERYGKNAHVYSWKEVLQILESSSKNELIEIWCSGEWIGGVLCETDAVGVHLRRLGWLNGDMRYYAKGVLAAVYWFGVSRAIEAGVSRLFFGEVHPYLEIGLFFYKTKWGGRLSHRHSNYGCWRVAVDPSHRDCRAFFDQYSLLMKSETTGKFNVLSGRAQEDVAQASAHTDQIGEWQRLDELPH